MTRRTGHLIKAWVRGGGRWLPGRAVLVWVWSVWQGGEEREAALLRLFRPPGLFQPYGVTGEERYPDIFAFVAGEIGDAPGRRLLSFGCARGDEVFSLRRWFPRASIRGLDISARRIAVCRRGLARTGGDGAIDFRVAGSACGEPAEFYDAVFAMAVFRHGDLRAHPARCCPCITFGDYERAVAGLARCLRPGGLLVMRFANFRFSDTAVAAGFEPILSRPSDPGTPLYGPDNRLCPPEAHEDVVFRKRG